MINEMTYQKTNLSNQLAVESQKNGTLLKEIAGLRQRLSTVQDLKNASEFPPEPSEFVASVFHLDTPEEDANIHPLSQTQTQIQTIQNPPSPRTRRPIGTHRESAASQQKEISMSTGWLSAIPLFGRLYIKTFKRAFEVVV